MLAGNGFTFKNDYTFCTGTTDPSSAYYATRDQLHHTRGLEPRHQRKNGQRRSCRLQPLFQWQNLPLYVSQAITFGTVTVGAPYNYPQIFNQNVQEYRDDLYYLTGKHSLKFGAEISTDSNTGLFQQNLTGTASACASIVAKTVNGVSVHGCSGGCRSLSPRYADVASTGTTPIPTIPLKPASTRSALLGTFTQGSGNFNVDIPRTQIAFWAQDDYKVLARLTLNLGLRYDNDLGIFNTDLKLNNGLADSDE